MNKLCVAHGQCDDSVQNFENLDHLSMNHNLSFALEMEIGDYHYWNDQLVLILCFH